MHTYRDGYDKVRMKQEHVSFNEYMEARYVRPMTKWLNRYACVAWVYVCFQMQPCIHEMCQTDDEVAEQVCMYTCNVLCMHAFKYMYVCMYLFT
jgi:hypothetical protein